VQAGYNAFNYYSANPYGTQADITTPDPQLRGGGWSWVRIAVQYSPSEDINYFAEIGPYKDATGVHINVSWAYPSVDFMQQVYRGYNPSIGVNYHYEILWHSGNDYDMYYNGNKVTTVTANLALTDVLCGGETYSNQNAIGISGCLNNQYAASSKGGWTLWPSHEKFENSNPPYHVTDIDSANWQVSGNN
jgi:hypothetical protein